MFPNLGVFKINFNSQRHPIDRSLTIKSNGVRIATSKGANARAVFDGEVSEILKLKNVNPIVMIRHGNYLTIYCRLQVLALNILPGNIMQFFFGTN